MSDTPFVTEDGQTVNYKEYLRTQTWERKRQEAFVAYDGECLLCAKPLVFCGIWNVHHKHYRNIGHEPIRDLVLLCYGCHKAYHDGLDIRRGRKPDKRRHKNRRKQKPTSKPDRSRSEKLERIAKGIAVSSMPSTGPFQSPPAVPRCRRE